MAHDTMSLFDLDNLRPRLALVNTWEEFRNLRYALVPLEPAKVFHALFTIAVVDQIDGADTIAGRLLVDLDPLCPLSCRDAILDLARGNWNPSRREVPFYLVTQFGKQQVLQVAEEVLANGGLEGWPRQAVETVKYWARFPAADLVEPLHYWQWKDVIEAHNA